MRLLVTYDVSTLDSAGRRRLRRVAKVCQNYGERVQKSVFECEVDTTTRTMLEQNLLDEIDLDQDNLRIYQLPGSGDHAIKEFGRFRATDFQDPLIV